MHTCNDYLFQLSPSQVCSEEETAGLLLMTRTAGGTWFGAMTDDFPLRAATNIVDGLPAKHSGHTVRLFATCSVRGGHKRHGSAAVPCYRIWSMKQDSNTQGK